ncbi:heme-binding protein [Gemmatirosa kalamazoonensis]|uniref:Heme-binding protein n=1 Tax=Gemmatirosa kalamazoonensis TaxID=861299 RepID=W0RFF5_9BACT|nr:HEAT repeat domain-containing protein [Gemmatirosa kalamazoonensis]AHG88118.1 heme-binding protein [Gemmatirosa kalamazoonensis]
MRLTPLLALLALAATQPPANRRATTRPPKLVRLTAAEQRKLADSAQRAVSVQAIGGLVATPWAPEGLVADPIAIDVDPQGVVYVTGSERAGAVGSLLDIRGHPTWVPTVHTLTTVPQLHDFYHKELSPARSAQNLWIPDLNRDGSHDWRDLTVPVDRVYRVVDRAGRGMADESRVLYEGFNADAVDDVANGLVALPGGDLLVAAAPDVSRLHERNGVVTRTPISSGYNVHPAFFGHGLAGLTLGPDGRVYWSMGDLGFDLVDKTGKRWRQPNNGAILRANPDGTDFEVYASGLRNPQAFAFDELGNIIASDNDGDHQGEYERVVYVTNGSDAGWRSTWQYGKYTDPANNRYNVWMDERMFTPRFPGQAAYIVPPVAPSHAGPSGLVYEPGTALGDRWRRTFFLTSFVGTPSGARVYAFTVAPDGAGFRLQSDTVALQGILGVGLRFGPDGAIYLADWIDGWGSKGRGRIWKIDTPADSASPARAETRKLIAESFAGRTSDQLLALLRHADMRVRTKAQFELVRRKDAPTLLAAVADAHASPRTWAFVHGIWGVAQLARVDARQAAALVPLLRDTDGEVRAQAAKMLGDLRYAPAADSLLPLLKDDAPRARFFAAEALGRLAYRPAVQGIVGMLADNDDRDVWLRQAGATALARIGDTAQVAALASHPSRGVRLAAVVTLRRLRSPDVARFLDDADEAVVTEAARAINDDGGIVPALPALARQLAATRFANTPLVRRAISANLRVGSREALDRLASYASSSGGAANADTLRAEALAALGAWANPSPMDRVDGAWLGPVPPRDAVAARAVVAKLVTSLPADANEELTLAALNAVANIGAKEAAPMLLAKFQSSAPRAVRAAALRALRAVGADETEQAVRTALADPDPVLRSAALGMVPALRLSDDGSAELLGGVAEKGTTTEQQSALASLGALHGTRAQASLDQLFGKLESGALAPEVRLDVAEAAKAGASPAVRERARRWLAPVAEGKAPGALGEALRRGGSAQHGREIVLAGPASECTRCHSIGTPGADVGPDLTHIASRITKEQMLEALLTPSARLAPGYGTVLLTLKDGKSVVGTLREESGGELVVETAPGKRQRVATGDVAKRTNLPSPMPPMGKLLTPREIRDVVEYLSTLR